MVVKMAELENSSIISASVAPATSTSPTCIVLKLLNNFDTLVNKPQVFVNCETITN